MQQRYLMDLMNIQQFCAGYGVDIDYYPHDPQKVHENSIHFFSKLLSYEFSTNRQFTLCIRVCKAERRKKSSYTWRAVDDDTCASVCLSATRTK